MKKTILSTVVSILCLTGLQAQEKHPISIENSTVEWVGEKVTGTHSGFVDLKNAYFLFEENKLVGGAFDIDMNSITCTDIENEEYAAKLVDHLKNDDFFATDKYPTANFKITKVIYDGTSYMVTGDMTIRDITEEITFPARFHSHGRMVHANANLKIDRTKHDIKYGSGSFFDDLGDKMIYNEFTLKIQLESYK
ncbi:YceI family protein [Flavobacteriales bacterium]|jgi:polyisoprenoid-binding protein YceI|nr:YceI family protein [Flavobacteriales bacterium]